MRTIHSNPKRKRGNGFPQTPSLTLRVSIVTVPRAPQSKLVEQFGLEIDGALVPRYNISPTQREPPDHVRHHPRAPSSRPARTACLSRITTACRSFCARAIWLPGSIRTSALARAPAGAEQEQRLLDLLAPFEPAKMSARRVSRLVNSAKKQFPRLHRPKRASCWRSIDGERDVTNHMAEG